MKTFVIIYLSGVVFFLAQAAIYARVSRERIIGALTWPVLVFVLPYIVHAYRHGVSEFSRTLRYNEGARVKSFRVGDRWGIGA